MNPAPSKIKLHRQSQNLELVYSDNRFLLSAEFLRVHSPSAEVKGHGPGQAILQINKQDVTIDNILAVGNYALKLEFSDGHDTGIYSWSYLKDLAENKDTYWQKYLEECEQQRETEITSAIKWVDPS